MKTLKLTLLALLISCTACAQEKENQNPAKKPEPDYSNVDYSAPSNIIKHPKQLTGDEKAIFYHPYFLKLTSEETKNLDPFKVKEEFAKLGITTDENDRFVDAYIFYKTYYRGHKKSCENWEYFKDLAPNFNKNKND